jgi:16S rRNA (adenine1518-N6/adenine1519-N6)-dimethyltransferase
LGFIIFKIEIVDFYIMSLSKEIRCLCKKYNIVPLRKRGQNFLINDFFIEKIMVAAELKKTDMLLEIGTGPGNLTKVMAQRVKKTITVEIDKKLAAIAREELKEFKNIEIIQDDISSDECFNVFLRQCFNGYKVVANIPFNLTGLILRKFLAAEIKPSLMVLITQKEVGERIIARPPRMSRLAVMVGLYGSAEIVGKISRNNFWPQPKIDSIILKIKPFNLKTRQPFDEKHFFKILNAGFSSPRKYLLNNLIKNAIIDKGEGKKLFQDLGLSEKIRAQELPVENWVKLSTELAN